MSYLLYTKRANSCFYIHNHTMHLQKCVRIHIEYRIDSLTSEQSRINPQRSEKVKQADGNNKLDVIIKRSKILCVFCPDQIKEQTTKLPSDICQTGRITEGKQQSPQICTHLLRTMRLVP